MKNLVCVYNLDSGSSLSAAELQKLFSGSSLKIQCFDIRRDLEKIKDSNCDGVVAVGGDGTVSAVAQVAVELGKPLGIIPAGTLNHFAKDVGVPMGFERAVEVITSGEIRRVDYCTVNGRVFVDNSSIGIYPSIVRHKERDRTRWGKWPAAVIAFLAAMFRNHSRRVEVCLPGETLNLRSPMIFVGNNHYELEKIGFTSRTNMVSGKLFVYIMRVSKTTSLLRLGLLNLFGLRQHSADLVRETGQSLVLQSGHKSVQVALDGEVVNLQFPLQYEIHPRSLQIFLP